MFKIITAVGCFAGSYMKLSVYVSYCNKASTAHSNHPFCLVTNVSICHVQVDPTMAKGELIIMSCNIIYTLLQELVCKNHHM